MSELLPDALSKLVEHQHGVVTGRQLSQAGMARETVGSRVVRGRWQRLYRGVYVTFSGRPDRHTTLWAAVLYAGPGAMLSYETAAELARLTDKPSRQIHVTIPENRRVTPVPGIRIHLSDRAAAKRDPLLLPPQTRIEETVLDLAAAAGTLDDACSWVLRAIQRSLIAPIYLQYALAQRSRTSWRSELAELLSPDADGLHSVLEFRYHCKVERPHALPVGTRQARARSGGGIVYRDLLYERYRTAVELDGNAYHPAETRWRDIQRDNAAAADDGVTTLRYGWIDATVRACHTAAEVDRMLVRNGYAGGRPCSPGCPVGQASQADQAEGPRSDVATAPSAQRGDWYPRKLACPADLDRLSSAGWLRRSYRAWS